MTHPSPFIAMECEQQGHFETLREMKRPRRRLEEWAHVKVRKTMEATAMRRTICGGPLFCVDVTVISE
ncbi:hypothetical protein DdX_10493 [Ditylenchus destructor]|uniref:Uncharacterized protein n=1 Tax=Ditylenchus destructor TaxID=166010 RepID=A0AAD4N404_9BILA|nr:hypothetical protein DdX_10493 [Ditylenchus destructor]